MHCKVCKSQTLIVLSLDPEYSFPPAIVSAKTYEVCPANVATQVNSGNVVVDVVRGISGVLLTVLVGAVETGATREIGLIVGEFKLLLPTQRLTGSSV